MPAVTGASWMENFSRLRKRLRNGATAGQRIAIGSVAGCHNRLLFSCFLPRYGRALHKPADHCSSHHCEHGYHHCAYSPSKRDPQISTQRSTLGGEKGHVVDPRQCRIGLRQRRLTADALATPEKVSVPRQVEIEAMAVSAAVVSGPP